MYGSHCIVKIVAALHSFPQQHKQDLGSTACFTEAAAHASLQSRNVVAGYSTIPEPTQIRVAAKNRNSFNLEALPEFG